LHKQVSHSYALGVALVHRIVEQCIAAGLVEGEQMSVDRSFIMANASHHSRIPREQFTEAAQVNHGARKYLEELVQENGDGEAIHQQDECRLPNRIRRTWPSEIALPNWVTSITI
jgi:hypothetical protein